MIVTGCSRRKKASIDPQLHPANLIAGSVSDVAMQWTALITSAPRTHRATSLYAGRSFTDAVWSAQAARLPHIIVSAGLGLVEAEQEIPAYALTTVGATDENVLSKCPSGTRPSDWWRAAFPDAPLQSMIAQATGRVHLALSRTYLEMIFEDLEQLTDTSLRKLRIFTGADETLKGSRFEGNILPYDARLDGPDSPLPGTKSDFSSRALRHFTTLVLGQPEADLANDRALVESSLSSMRLPALPKRERRSDEEIRAELIAVWAAMKGNRQRMLRHLRDTLLISCEQSRFARIARELEGEGLR
ncbi:hypothetical protein [Stagnihabitans tardus]|uniref:Uncharacterized protein n=1 Tax=Stagnihabitans tardus TaxID=2699202 RepID=A0AAE4YH28_9RHOB|nr:hypothetical protein [Stagnihabitans tardus]NBZ89640.1 hypothetical protein [Stagnihabitans tardus]